MLSFIVPGSDVQVTLTYGYDAGPLKLPDPLIIDHCIVVPSSKGAEWFVLFWPTVSVHADVLPLIKGAVPPTIMVFVICPLPVFKVTV